MVEMRGKMVPGLRVRIPPSKHAGQAVAPLKPKHSANGQAAATKPPDDENSKTNRRRRSRKPPLPTISRMTRSRFSRWKRARWRAGSSSSPPHLFPKERKCRAPHECTTYHISEGSSKAAACLDAAAQAPAVGGMALDATGERQLAKAAFYGKATAAACQHQGSDNVE